MPFLRFSRDKRGYETTALVHAVRRQGRGRYRLLYWFRTPPDVKVGRPALDEDAIRWIEEHNPDIEFDWPKILEAKPPPVQVDDPRNRRGRRDRPERQRPARGGAPQAHVSGEREPEPQREPDTEPEPRREPEPAPEPQREPDPELEPEPEPESELEGVAEVPAVPRVPEDRDVEEVLEVEMAEAFEQLTHPDTEERIELPPTPAEQVIGREQLVRLRARYAELQARITERGDTAERIETLRAQAESLNPDTWVTADDARQGLERFEAAIRDLRAALGLRRRRRSRRGGRRRPPQTGQADTPGNSSNGQTG